MNDGHDYVLKDSSIARSLAAVPVRQVPIVVAGMPERKANTGRLPKDSPQSAAHSVLALPRLRHHWDG